MAVGVLDLDQDGVRGGNGKEVLDVLSIEADRHAVPIILHRDGLARLALVRGGRRERQLAGSDGQLDRPCALRRYETDAADGGKEGLSAHANDFLALGGDHVLEGRELPLDHLGGQRPAAGREEQMCS